MKQLKIQPEKPRCPVGWHAKLLKDRWVCVPDTDGIFSPHQINATSFNSPSYNLTPNRPIGQTGQGGFSNPQMTIRE